MKKTALIALPLAALIGFGAAACSSDDDSSSSSSTTTSAAPSEAATQRPADVKAQELSDAIAAKFPNAKVTAYHGQVSLNVSKDDKDVVTFVEQQTGMTADAKKQIADAGKDPSSVTYDAWLVNVTPDDQGGSQWRIVSIAPSN
ncbi:hypothetical protein GCM10025864_43980 [Luteimicrobium album]|uniref:Lipoprotein n=1 Tax=Luteimicrobium album TaxID=1054550 RepID=A0ABQ6I9F5_9MICO|nr:hypothetical protein [Luteimicrobium album]GMA26639.1 hypothetical protein GCM10025864_43980 [Luteimicrobium album]